MAIKTKKAKTKKVLKRERAAAVAAAEAANARRESEIATTQPREDVQKPRSRQEAFVDALSSPDDLVRDNVGDFVNFIREHAIVGLAVGFVVGTQVQAVVKQLIASFIDPLSKLLFGSRLSSETFTVTWHGRSSDFGWGALVYSLIDFLFILATIYIVIQVFSLDKLDKTKK